MQDYLVAAQVKPPIKSQSRAKTAFFKHRRWLKILNLKTFITTENKSSIQNCIYLIQCICGKRCVGETGNTTAARFHQYKYKY